GGREHVKRRRPVRRKRRLGFQGSALREEQNGPRRGATTGARALMVAMKRSDEVGSRRGNKGVQEGGDVKLGPCGKTPTTLPSGLKPPERVSTLMTARRTAGLNHTDADGASQAGPLGLRETPCLGPSVLLEATPPSGDKPDAGRSARPVRRE